MQVLKQLEKIEKLTKQICKSESSNTCNSIGFITALPPPNAANSLDKLSVSRSNPLNTKDGSDIDPKLTNLLYLKFWNIFNE